MTLSDLSIRRPVFAWMLMAAMIIFGIIGFSRMGVSQLPDVEFPVLSINVTYQGAAPDVMEAVIVDKIEQAIVAIAGIRDITSSISQGRASVTIEFDINKNIDTALQEVQAAISRIRFPDKSDPPVIFKANPNDRPILWIGLVGPNRSLHDLIVYVDLYLKDRFSTIPGVGELFLGGFTERNLRVWVDEEKLKKYELTILDVQRAIESQQIEVAAGVIENERNQFNLRTMGEGLSVEQVENILIPQRGSQPIYDITIKVKDVARVEDGLNTIQRISRVSGTQAVSLGITKQRGANAVEVARLVKEKVAELNQTLPEDLQLRVVFDSTTFIEEAVHETEFTLVLAAIICSIVCFFFLGSWSSTFNVLLSIPTSIIGAFLIIYFLGFTLNFFTLLALSLAVGIVVDDAIMVLENIVRHGEMGKGKVAAARDGAREITFAATAATVAVIAIFVPVAFTPGITGKFLYQFGMTLSVAVALSLLEAITLTPMRASQFVQANHQKNWVARTGDNFFEWLAARYISILEICLSHRWKVIAAAFILFAASLLLVGKLRKELVPAQDQGIFIMTCETPVGSSLEYTNQKVRAVENFLKTRPEVAEFFTAIGGFRGGEVTTANLFVTMKPRNERTVSQFELMDVCREEFKKIPDLKTIVIDLSSSGFSSQRSTPVEFNIRGPDWAKLTQFADQIFKEYQKNPLIRDLDTDYRAGMPEVRVVPDRQAAAARGVTMDAIGQTVQAAIGGVPQNEYTNDGRRYDVRIRLEQSYRTKAEDILNLQIRNIYGELVLMKDVAKIEIVPTVQTITRRNRERSISFFSNLAPNASQAEALNEASALCEKILPKGYRMYFSGTAATLQESNYGALLTFFLGILVAYMVLAVQFNSFIHPWTVLLALPFSITGAFVALFLTNQSLNFYSLIGIVLLAGIVKKNSILLVEFANNLRYIHKKPLFEAIISAGRVRLRPILMTSSATLAAAVPGAIALGPGAESRIPMSITILGGVLVSTVLTLVVVPCAYSLFARLERTKAILTLEEFERAEHDLTPQDISEPSPGEPHPHPSKKKPPFKPQEPVPSA